MVFNGVTVYVLDEQNVPRVVANNLDKAKFIAFSELANQRLSDQGTAAQRVPRNSIILHCNVVDTDAATKILKWISTNDPSKPKPMSLAALSIDRFDQAVAAHYTSNALHINRDFRGNEIRNTIYDYCKEGSLSMDKFGMIIEYLRFDLGLTKTAKHMVMHGKAKGGLHVPPDFERIKAYCQQNGLWEEMCEIESEILQKMREKDEEDTMYWEQQAKMQDSHRG